MNLACWKEARIGIKLGYRLIPIKIENTRPVSANLLQTVHWQFTPRWAVSASGGFAAEFPANTLSTRPSRSPTAASQETGGASVRPMSNTVGISTGMLHWRATEGADVYLRAQFMGLTDPEISGEGRRAQLNLGKGLYFTAAINWPF